MKKIIVVLFLIVMIIPFQVQAAGDLTVSPSVINIVTGNTASFTITASNFIGDVSITSGSSSVATVSQSFWETGVIEAGQIKTGTINVTGINVGTTTITLYIDGATFDGDDFSGQTRTITVNVTNPAPAPVTPPVTPAPVTPTVPTIPTTPTTPTNPNPGGTTNENTNINNADSNANNNTTVTNPEEKNPTVEKEQPKEPKPLDITKFEILGYDIKFKNDVTNYELKIDKNLKKLYLVIEGNEITVEGNGIVDITNKDKIVVKIKNSEQEVDYTINLKKQALGAVVQTEDRGNIFMATTIIFGWSTIILAIFLVKDITKYKKTKQEQSL